MFNKKLKPPLPPEVYLVVDITYGVDKWELIQKESSKEAADKFAKGLVKKTNEVYGVFKLVGITECEIKVR